MEAEVLKDLEAKLLDPSVRSDGSQLDALLSEDFLEFGASGRVYRKQDILDRLPESDDVEVGKISDFNCQLEGTLAHVTYKLMTSYANGDMRSTLRSSIWRKSDGHWCIVFHQGTVESI